MVIGNTCRRAGTLLGTRAYLASTGRTAEEITQANRSWEPRPDSDAGPGQADGTGSGKPS